MEEKELAAVLEALLFVSGEPIPLERLQEVLEGEEPASLTHALHELTESYQDGGRGLKIIEVAGGYQMVTQPHWASWIRRLEEVKTAARLSRPALEALAVVAYKQPVTRPEIEAIRGVDSSYVLKTLLERRLVRITGRRQGLGRPMLYGTTREFLEYFGLKDLSELPALKEFQEITEVLPEYEPIHEPAGKMIS